MQVKCPSVTSTTLNPHWLLILSTNDLKYISTGSSSPPFSTNCDSTVQEYLGNDLPITKHTSNLTLDKVF